MIVIDPVTPQKLAAFRRVRLGALLQDPIAFCATYEREYQLSESEWQARAERMNGEEGIGFLAMDSETGTGCGIVCSFLEETDPQQARVVSMWTAPERRRQGVGRLLIDSVATWARGRSCKRLLLMVTSVNEGAIGFYEQLGFVRTGRTEPYPNNPAVVEHEMVLSIL